MMTMYEQLRKEIADPFRVTHKTRLAVETIKYFLHGDTLIARKSEDLGVGVYTIITKSGKSIDSLYRRVSHER